MNLVRAAAGEGSGLFLDQQGAVSRNDAQSKQRLADMAERAAASWQEKLTSVKSRLHDNNSTLAMKS